VDLTRADWRKSSYSSNNGNCVEVARSLPGMAAVRDSKDPGGSVLAIESAGWRAFIADVKAGRHDLT
jgi:hypothetical protein